MTDSELSQAKGSQRQGRDSLFDARPQFGSNGCIVTYEAVEEAMDEGDTGCPICGMAPGWHLTEDQAGRSRIDG